jgi:murein DD-endopeptidase MepM/ murein hydrolase activator NlpD
MRIYTWRPAVLNCLGRLFIILLVLLFSSKISVAQEIQDEPINVFESESDSANLTSGYFDVYDSLGELFFNSDSSSTSIMKYSRDSITGAFGSDWSNDVLFLFNKDFDANKMEDSIRIILEDNDGHCFYPPRIGRINSEFGWRRWQFHYGMDINLSKGDTVRSAFDGVVRVSKWGWGYGNVIVIRHVNGLETLYGHLSASKVVPNQSVKAGDVIGLGGSTGHSTGPHLHFEVRYKGIPLNPNSLIDFKYFKLWKDTIYISRESFQYVKGIKKVAGNARYYTVKNGDTLSKIALRYGTNVANICRLNGIRPTTTLNLGRTIRVW